MKIAIACDHAGLESKERIKSMLESMHYEVKDHGTYNDYSCDYPDFAYKVAKAVANKEAKFGILICGSGIGMSIAANKIKGVRAGVCTSEEAARLSRCHNNCNVLCLGERLLDIAQMDKIVKKWLNTEFEGGRHQRRTNKIAQIEKKE